MTIDSRRRSWLGKVSLALAAIPVVGVSGHAEAKTNPALRAALKYQDTPKDGKACDGCIEFVAGPSEKDLGQCKKIPDDDEISPDGYCDVWKSLVEPPK